MPTEKEVCVVVPAFNEAQVVGGVIRALTAGTNYHVVVVDDGSEDETFTKLLTYPVTVLRHACNLGQGAALTTGIQYACRLPQTRFVVTFDADGQHSPDDIPRLLAPLEQGTHDVVLGSRFSEKGRAVGIGLVKRA